MEPTIQIQDLAVRFGRRDALRGLNLEVRPGRCHALLGRNGAGKTTTLKALMGLVAAERGQVRIFGLDPLRHEEEVKSRLSFVPDSPGFYPWMSVQQALDYAASFRPRWSVELERSLLAKFQLESSAPAAHLSKGQRTQLALICALAHDPELLILDEPTSGLDPLVRRQFIEAVIGAFQERDPERKTLLVSTHLISEFEGIVDEFTVVEAGRAVMTLQADEARGRFHRIRAWFEREAPAEIPVKTLQKPKREGRMVEVLIEGEGEDARRRFSAAGATRVEASALSLEEIFLATAHA